MHLLKWLYPGMRFKRWMLLFALGVMMVSLGLALVFNYKYLDLIEESIFRAVYLWRGSYDYIISSLVGVVIVALGTVLMLVAMRFIIRSVITVILPAWYQGMNAKQRGTLLTRLKLAVLVKAIRMRFIR